MGYGIQTAGVGNRGVGVSGWMELSGGDAF